MRRSIRLGGSIAAAILITSCSSGTDSSTATAPPPSVELVDAEVDRPSPSVADDVPDESSDDGSDQQIDTDSVIGTSSSGGAQPELRWEPIDDAVLYSIVVYDPAGEPFWGWQGSETSVTVGEGAPDPLVDRESTWSLIALDADGESVGEAFDLPV
jgi:hypothetical protein